MSTDGSAGAARAGRPAAPVEHRGLKLAGLVSLAAGLGLVRLGIEPDAGFGGGAFAQALRWQGLAVLVLGINSLALAWVLLAAGFGGRRDWRDARVRRATLWRWLAANLVVPVFAAELWLGTDAVSALALGGPVGEAPSDPVDGFTQLLGSLVSLGLFLLILLFGRRSAQHEAASAEEAMRLDPRPPVVYLRSFQDDGQALHAPFDPGGMGRRIAGILLRTPEQELADALAHVGPVIAIGKPGERLPELGAARLYVPHEAWQARVHALLDAAALVVLRVGGSEGVRWEIEQTLAQVPPERRVFVLLGTPALLEAGSALLGPMIGHALQWPALPRSRWQTVQAALGLRPRLLGALVTTDRTGITRQWPLLLSQWRLDDLLSQVQRRPAGPALRRAMAAIDAPWARTQASGPSRGRVVGLALLLGGVGAHWFYLRRHRLAAWHLLLFPLTLSIFWAWWQALRWLLMDRVAFERSLSRAAPGWRATAPRSAPPQS